MHVALCWFWILSYPHYFLGANYTSTLLVDIQELIRKAANFLGYNNLFPNKVLAISSFIKGLDIFVSEKLLCYISFFQRFSSLQCCTTAIIISPLQVTIKWSTAVDVGILPCDSYGGVHNAK